MICTHCGTEIADKALICYKCGHPTAEPRIAPPAARRKRSRRPLVALLILIVIALLTAWRLGLMAPAP